MPLSISWRGCVPPTSRKWRPLSTYIELEKKQEEEQSEKKKFKKKSKSNSEKKNIKKDSKSNSETKSKKILCQTLNKQDGTSQHLLS